MSTSFTDSLCGASPSTNDAFNTNPTYTTASGPTSQKSTVHTAVAIAQQMKLRQDKKLQAEAGLTSDFLNFTSSPKTVLMAFFLIVIYLISGTVIFYTWIEEWSAVDAIYFTICTFTTIGFGDIYPQTMGQRIFAIFFVVFGIMIIGGVVLGILTDALFNLVKNGKKKAVEDFMDKFEDGTDSIDEAKVISSLSKLLTAAVVVAMLFGPAFIIGHLEGWKFYQSLYFAVVASSTVGYGDLSPQNTNTRIIACFYLPLCVTIMAGLFAKTTSIFMDKKAAKAEAGFLERKLTREDIANMDIEGDGKVDSEEFLVFMLCALGKVSADDIEKIYKSFNSFDEDKSGELDLTDIADTICESQDVAEEVV